MSYKCTFNNDSAYLVHFNKNHDKKGQFTFGDGDGDGVRDDHAHADKNDVKKAINEKYNKRMAVSGALIGSGAAITAAGYFLSNPIITSVGLSAMATGTTNLGMSFVNKYKFNKV